MTPQSGDTALHTRRLDKASRYVSDYWFPVNAELLNSIQSNLAQGRYDSDLPGLVKAIEGDFSLFLYCFKKLVEMMKHEGVVPSAAFNPIEALELAGLDKLREILNAPEKSLLRHSFEGASDFQVARFREAMLSASTAEALSESYAVDAETAYSAALIRQFGFALIAWNYPSLYQEALTALKPGEKLELVLAQSLGFSPTLLAMRLLNDWGLNAQIWTAFGLVDPEAQEEETVLDAIGATVAELCKVGEALARANDPDRYPTAREDWEFAKQEIETRLGSSGLALIQERYREHCEAYLTYIPHVFHAGTALEAPLSIENSRKAVGAGGRNPHMAKCDNAVQRQLRKLYLTLSESSGDPQQNLRLFVRDIVPGCGFSAGCIYSIDPGVMMLVPQLEIGYSKTRSYKAVDYSVVTSNSDLVAVAYQSADPVVAYRIGEAGQPISMIAGVFGSAQRAGVLLLELPRIISSKAKDQDILHFKALQYALNDCLSL